MKWDELSRVLNVGLGVTRVTLPTGVVRAGQSLVDLYDVVKALIESEDDFDALEGDGPLRLIEEAGLFEPLLDFDWDSFGPMSSNAQLRLLHPRGSRWFVCWLAEDEDKVIAALDPLCPETVCAFLRDLLAENGESYGLGLFGALPSRTVNYRSDLIPAAIVNECYWAWMQWASAKDPSHWASLRNTVIKESEEPNPLRRGLRALEDLKRLGTPVASDAIHRFLEEGKQAGADLSDDERLLILNNYFAVSYQERRR